MKPNLEEQLVPTIDPSKLTLADWKRIAEVLDCKVAWAFKSWTKAKGEAFLQGVGIDQWLSFAKFLGNRPNWATDRYVQYKGATDEGKEVA
jgi:hypothetical protein